LNLIWAEANAGTQVTGVQYADYTRGGGQNLRPSDMGDVEKTATLPTEESVLIGHSHWHCSRSSDDGEDDATIRTRPAESTD
jgi:hypothetical protein